MIVILLYLLLLPRSSKFPTGVPALSVEQMTAMEEENGIAGDVPQLRIGNTLVIGDRPTLLKTMPGRISFDQCLRMIPGRHCGQNVKDVSV